MHVYCRSVVVLLISALLGGCITRYPMGLSESQWNSLSPDKQAELQAQQFALDQQLYQQRESMRLERERIAREERVAQQEATRNAYAQARYGDILTISVRGGFLQWGGRRYAYEPVAFDLVRGEAKDVEFRGLGPQTVATTYRVRLSDDGNTVHFADGTSYRTVFVNTDWEKGERIESARIRNDVGVVLDGCSIYLKHKMLPGAPNRLIIETR